MSRWKIIFCILFLMSTPIFAVEIRGTVTSVQEDGTARVQIDGNQGAMAGDSVRIIWKVGGETLDVRAGIVAETGQGMVAVQLSPGESAVSPSMTAIIQSSGGPSATGTSTSSASLPPPAASERSGKSSTELMPIDTRSMEGSQTRSMSPEEKAFEADMFYGLAEKAYNDQRWKVAFDFFRKSSVSGHAKAPGFVGYLTSQGLGTEKNPQEAMRWFLLGEERGDPFSISEVGEGYESGESGLVKDERAAFERYQLAADMGWVRAMRKTGWFLQNGVGIGPDLAEALVYYRQAAELGSRLACNDIGWFYRQGLGGLQVDQKQANFWFAKAADQGLGLAMYNLGESYRQGLGVKIDKAQAENWYQKALGTGDQQAESWAIKGLKQLETVKD